MYVDGIGERTLVDGGGWEVVWTGNSPNPIQQNGGDTSYGAWSVFWDAQTGDAYQLGDDWHVRPVGQQAAEAPAPTPAPTITDHFYYVDSGRIIEKTVYSDGNVTYADTGYPSSLGNGAASGNMLDLIGTAGLNPQPAAGGGAPSSGGFDQANGAGGFGPYATQDPPQLRDVNQYVQGGRLMLDQVDQYGNHYYSDLGPAPQQQQPNRTVSAGKQAPTVQRPAQQQPQQPQRNLYQPTYQTVNGPRTVQQMANELRAVGYGGPWDESSVITTYAHTTGGSVSLPQAAPAAQTTPRQTPPATSPTVRQQQQRGSSTAAINIGGNPTQFAQGVVDWLSRSDWIGGVPNVVVVAGGVAAAQMLRGRRRR